MSQQCHSERSLTLTSSLAIKSNYLQLIRSSELKQESRKYWQPETTDNCITIHTLYLYGSNQITIQYCKILDWLSFSSLFLWTQYTLCWLLIQFSEFFPWGPIICLNKTVFWQIFWLVPEKSWSFPAQVWCPDISSSNSRLLAAVNPS